MKQYTRIVATVLLLVTAAAMVIVTSFAWLTISSSPVAQGIQITISGSDTIMVAPDMIYTQGGKVFHYPGAFSNNLNFADHAQYGYLQQSGGLVPVSTADGQIWYLPVYYQKGDEQVQSGNAMVGQLRPTSEFLADNTLSYANLSADSLSAVQQGNYVYLDFWVVAPIDGYQLRVSTGEDSAGSFAVDLLEPEAVTADGKTDYYLTEQKQQAAACMRVGFLANADTVLDDSMRLYTQSQGYNSSYSRLQGIYSEPGLSAWDSPLTRFTIYEPNGDLHPTTVPNGKGGSIENGQYVLTEPLGPGGLPTDVSDRLSVQLVNRWAMAGEEPVIAQMFRTFMASRNVTGETEQSLKQAFYTQWLQYQYYPYVAKGNFLNSTSNLYALAGNDKTVQPQEIAGLEQSGATEDVYITELTGGVPQRIRLFIWLEGQDVDCINSAATGSFALSIELAGSNKS